MVQPSTDTIDASVSKSFFVEMLVKDINLEMAIHDLLDNCIDGAIRLRNGGTFDGLAVDISLSREEFMIRDNCGGIDVDIARNYAFRFGRPKEAPKISHSVGRFGVGMKRAVFKLGQRFSVESTSESHRFLVDVDVAAWEESPNWEFKFEELEEFPEGKPVEERGTKVLVTQLFESVADRFALDIFVSRLNRAIASRHQAHLEKGLVVRLNGLSIVATPVQYLVLDNYLYPAFSEQTYNGVTVRQMVGVGPRNPSDAGWYVYCNGRMVLEADQSEVTGWGEPNIERLPKYHNDFAWFRGCVFFDSADPEDLPWNTTKDGLDQDSGLYRSVKRQMITSMTPVLDFLRAAANEQEPDEPLTELLRRAEKVTASQVQTQSRSSFFYRKPAFVPREQRLTRIAYDRPTGIVDQVKRKLGVTTNRAVGERTFDYYKDLELELEE